MAHPTITLQEIYTATRDAITGATSLVRARHPLDVLSGGANWMDGAFVVKVSARPEPHGGIARMGDTAGPMHMAFTIRVTVLRQDMGEPQNMESTIYAHTLSVYRAVIAALGPAGTASIVTGAQVTPVEPGEIPEPEIVSGAPDWEQVELRFTCTGLMSQS